MVRDRWCIFDGTCKTRATTSIEICNLGGNINVKLCGSWHLLNFASFYFQSMKRLDQGANGGTEIFAKFTALDIEEFYVIFFKISERRACYCLHHM